MFRDHTSILQKNRPNSETHNLFYTKYLILLFPFISIHLKSTIYITAHQLSGIVYKSMRCMSAIEGEGEWW